MVYKLKPPARKRRAARRRNPKFGIHRPTLQFTSSGWKRPRRKSGRKLITSRLFPKAVRINAARASRRSMISRFGFRKYRRNPGFNVVSTLTSGLKIAGGITAGMMLMPLLVKFMPKDAATGKARFRKFYGLIHLAAGTIGASVIKQQAAKEVLLVVAGTGLYDLIASNLAFLGLPALPDSTKMLGGAAGEEAPAIGDGETAGTDYAPAIGASYGSSYEGDDISYGGDEVEIE